MSEKTQTETIAGKLPPQNLDAEKSLLGAILIDEEVLADASEIVKPNDFYDKNHGLIFAGMMRLFEKHKPVDLLTLTDELKRKDGTHQLRADGSARGGVRRNGGANSGAAAPHQGQQWYHRTRLR